LNPITRRVDVTYDFRSEHERLVHPGDQDRAASRVRPGQGHGGIHPLLGVPPQTGSSYYVGFEAAGQQIGLVPGGGPQGMASPVAYWHVPDIEAKLAEVTAAGATVREPARDVGGARARQMETR
jgi:predicted enzyme related to lactoylglutathione lyase